MHSLRPALLTVLAFGLSACAERSPEPAVPEEAAAAETPADTPPETPLETVSYRCGDLEVEARFYREGAVLVIGDEEHALSQVLSASGARYASGSDPADIELWAKGPEAMLTLHGTRYPTCHETAAGTKAAQSYRALGQEPGWSLRWHGEGTPLTLDLGDDRVEAADAERVETQDGWLLVAPTASGELRMTVERGRLCRDSMSGMPHPDSVRLSIGEHTLEGCGGEPATLLQGGEWRLAVLDGDAVPSAPEITLVFFADGQVAGRGGCNSYSGRYTLSGEGLSVGPIAATKMMCLDEGVMAREARFLDILGKAARFHLDDEGRLHIETADGRSLLATLDVG
jgi:heat shock protein HslJ/membrane-bound inhibitor of C-type lysozyme